MEIELGFCTKRSTPKPNFAELHGFENSLPQFQAGEDAVYDVIEFWLTEHGSDESVLDFSGLDGYFAAIACSPEVIMPSIWMPAIWGGEAFAPEWQSKKDVDQFTRAVFDLYHTVLGELKDGHYTPAFLEHEDNDDPLFIVDEWCDGFLRGLNLWGGMPPEDMRHLEKCLYPIRYFCTDEGAEQLDEMTDAEIIQLQKSIAPNVEQLYRHFFKPAKTAATTFVHSTPKVGRNEPCPCGSGKKYKKCCGLN